MIIFNQIHRKIFAHNINGMIRFKAEFSWQIYSQQRVFLCMVLDVAKALCEQDAIRSGFSAKFQNIQSAGDIHINIFIGVVSFHPCRHCASKVHHRIDIFGQAVECIFLRDVHTIIRHAHPCKTVRFPCTDSNHFIFTVVVMIQEITHEICPGITACAKYKYFFHFSFSLIRKSADTGPAFLGQCLLN